VIVQCPDANVLLEFVSGDLSGHLREDVEIHIDVCGDCAELVADLVRTARSRADAPTVSGASTAAAPAAEAQPERLGRYVLLEKIGAGGMGEVYLAYDPELERKVALKVLRADQARLPEATGGRARLLREAQAAAALTHRNVVTIYDVGTFDDEVFIAMEFVDGVTLGAWQSDHPRTWHEVLGKYRMAAEGLIAAHDADLVHRDFKPDNVLVANDGTARVLDFGLAKPRVEGGPASKTDASASTSGGSRSSANLTRTGVVLGTPAYMSPEQFRGGSVGPASDQFSFCVALWEGLFGSRPFGGLDYDTLRGVVTKGVVEAPPRGRSVPAWLERVVRKGLSPEVADRHPSMRALLAELDRVPRRRRAVALVSAVVLGATAVGGLAFREGQRQQETPCDPDTRLRSVWSPQRRDAVEAAFLRTGRPFAESSWTATRSALDAHFGRWRAGYLDACEATRVRGEQSQSALEHRMRCLDRRLNEAGVLLSLLQDADAELVRNAPKAVGAMAGIGVCSDAEGLERVEALPDDAVLCARITAAETEVARARALLQAGQYDEAKEAISGLQPEAESIGYRPLLARVMFQLGDIEDRLGHADEAQASLHAALMLAEASGDEATATEALAALTYVVGVELADHERGRFLGDFSIAKAERIPSDTELQAAAHSSAGMVAYSAGDNNAAVKHVEHAIALVESRDMPVTLMPMLNVIGTVERVRGQPERARAHFERALALGTEALAPSILSSAPASATSLRFCTPKANSRRRSSMRARRCCVSSEVVDTRPLLGCR
jgi:serine/threonine protein kinase